MGPYMKMRVPRHFYGQDGEAEGDEGEGMRWKVVPASLRDQICYMHHYSAMAAHKEWHPLLAALWPGDE